MIQTVEAVIDRQGRVSLKERFYWYFSGKK